MTCGETRLAQPRSLRYLDLREEPSGLRYLNQREEFGRLSHLDQLGEGGASATSTSGSLRETRRIFLRETRRSSYPEGPEFGPRDCWCSRVPVHGI